MELADRESNPYAAPRETSSVQVEDRRCSYCGEPATVDRKLVESPDGRALICRACAAIVIDAIDGRQERTVWRIVSVGLRVAFVALLLGAWAFGEYFGTNLPSTYGLLIAALAVLLLLNFGVWTVRRSERLRYR